MEAKFRLFKQKTVILFLIILAIGLIPRLYTITYPFDGHHSFNEAFYSDESRNYYKHGLTSAQTAFGLPNYTNPPFFLWLVSISFTAFGVSEAAARLIPLIFGALTVILVFFLASSLFNRRIGLFSAFLLSFAPMHIYYSRNVQLETQMLFFMTAAILFLVLWMKGKQDRYFYLSGLMGGLGVFTKYPAVIILLPVLVVFLSYRKLLSYKKICLWFTAFILPIALWLLYATSKVGLSSLIPYASGRLITQASVPEFLFWEAVTLVFALSPIIFIFFVLEFFPAIRSLKVPRKKIEDILLVTWVIGALAYVLVFAGGAWYHDYYLFPILVPAVILAAKLVDRGYRIFAEMQVMWRLTFVAALMIIALISISSSSVYFSVRTPGIKEAGLYVKGQTADNAVILAGIQQVAFYAERSSHFWGEVEIETIEDFLNEKQPEYIVIDPNWTEDWGLSNSWALLDYLIENCQLEKEFHEVKVFKMNE